MTSNDNHDPVNRWATEHYGFDDEPVGRAADREGAPLLPSTAPPPVAAGRRRRRRALIASGVLSLAMIAGIGGVAVAADDGGGPGGPADGRATVVQLDGDHGRHAGDPGGGRR